MAAISARDTEVLVSSTEGGTYTCIGKVLTASLRYEATDDESIYVFCDETPIVEAGADEATLDLTMLWDFADTTGQDVLRTARAAGSTVYIQFLPDGAIGYQQAAVVRSMSIDSDANGTGVNRFVRGAMTLTMSGTITSIGSP